MCSSPLFSPSFLSTTTTPLFSPFFPSLLRPPATFWKVCLGSVTASFVVRQRESIQKRKKGKVSIYSKQKRQGANILNKKRKRRKGKAAPYKATELHLGGRSFPLLGATPFPCFGIWCNILPYFRLSSFGKKNSGCCEPP